MIVALFKPEIPHNTGNIARLCVATNTPLIIGGKPSFSLDDSHLKRAGLDYWQYLNLTLIPLEEDFWEWLKKRPFALLSKKGEKLYTWIPYSEHTVLVFGSETTGLPERILKEYTQHTYRVPMWGNVRSLNLSTSAGIVLYEGYRQLGFTQP